MGRSAEDGEITLTPGPECEVGDIFGVNWLGLNGRIKVTRVDRVGHSTRIHYVEIEPLTRQERRGKDKPAEKYYLKYAKRKAI